MGNGFTFELESLLFYVTTKVTADLRGVRGALSVYGDDIICPSEIAYELTSALRYLGFQVNTDKSFYQGPLRESCGGHYYAGIDITPFKVKKPLVHLVDVMDVANKLRSWAELVEPSISQNGKPIWGVLDPEVEGIWLWLKSFVPALLWGGTDMAFKFQLASYDAPSYKLVIENNKKDSGPGGYPHWLNATWERSQSSDGISTSRRSVETGKYRLKRVRVSTVSRLHSLFLHELGMTTGLTPENPE
jgi:hypothetical protein